MYKDKQVVRIFDTRCNNNDVVKLIKNKRAQESSFINRPGISVREASSRRVYSAQTDNQAATSTQIVIFE